MTCHQEHAHLFEIILYIIIIVLHLFCFVIGCRGERSVQNGLNPQRAPGSRGRRKWSRLSWSLFIIIIIIVILNNCLSLLDHSNSPFYPAKGTFIHYCTLEHIRTNSAGPTVQPVGTQTQLLHHAKYWEKQQVLLPNLHTFPNHKVAPLPPYSLDLDITLFVSVF